MKTLVTGALCALLCLACGPASQDDPCGLGLDLPSVDDGAARYRENGVQREFSGGGYRLDFPHDLVMGSLTINAKQDGDKRRVQDLVETGRFPICVPLNAQSDGSGYALIEDGGRSFLTSDTHGGTLSILAKDGELLIGLFSFDAGENSGSQVTQVRDGAFRLRPR